MVRRFSSIIVRTTRQELILEDSGGRFYNSLHVNEERLLLSD
jgi:hypothetical protein